MLEKFKLDNGLQVILAPQKGSQSLTVLVAFKVGSRYETVNIHHGVSHFIEHLMFKGTKKRPSPQIISKELDGIGAEFNAFTAKDHTGYYIKSSADQVELALDILSDIISNSTFPENEIKREKGVIIEEIKMYEDMPLYYSEMLFENLIYQGNALGEDIAGTEESIKKMSRKNILDFYKSHYEPTNGTIIIAGKINKKIKSLLNKYFIQLQKDKEKVFLQKFNPFINAQDQPRVLLHYRDTKQVHLALGFPAYSYYDPEMYALQILAIILGGNMSSRLFVNIREKKGLCYFIRSQADIYEDTGNLMIRSGLDINKIEEAVSLIIKELVLVREKGVTAKELYMAKKFIKGHTILQFEDSSNLANYYAKQYLLNPDILTPEQKLKKIEKVTRSQIQNVAQEIIKKQKFNLAMISPYKDQKQFLKLIKL